MVLIKPFIWDKIGFDSNSDLFYNKNELEEIMANKKFTEQEMLETKDLILGKGKIEDWKADFISPA